MGVASAVQASAMPSMAAESWAMISGFSGIAEVEAVGGGHGRCAGAGHLAGGFGHGVHGAQLGIEIGPAAVAVQRHGQAALMPCGSGSLDAHHAGFAAGADARCWSAPWCRTARGPSAWSRRWRWRAASSGRRCSRDPRLVAARTSSGGSSGTGHFQVPTGRW